ncbi:MAG: hypothetical protein OJF59_001827 [Cytophagales bacterium]|jgi:hypothetical protein|nr:hypothetical protein [Bacteroidota bacterium]MBS1950703.1 hypothetical protein [Bacteroidota bacterium]MBS1980737.1 hypothetical protein [Bacteroidota bacterium]WHZ08074.1 MAG: hypothetical protein OJF59_001827 [Cytophagales bacterium]
MKSRKDQIEEIITEIVQYEKSLDRILFDKEMTYIKSYKQFLVDAKIQELVNRLVQEKQISGFVVDLSNQGVLNNRLLLEWEQYKKIPKTNLTYRYDKGKGVPGNQDHIHVYLGNTKNQVYAINRDGSPHDGSTLQLGKKEIEFIKGLGFTPPSNGILEWITLDEKSEYIVYDFQLLFS